MDAVSDAHAGAKAGFLMVTVSCDRCGKKIEHNRIVHVIEVQQPHGDDGLANPKPTIEHGCSEECMQMLVMNWCAGAGSFLWLKTGSFLWLKTEQINVSYRTRVK